MDPNTLASSFVQHYYSNFCNQATRANVLSLYSPTAQMIFNGTHCRGVEAIQQQLERMSFKTINIPSPTISAMDLGGRYLVKVSGLLSIDESNQPIGFAHVFVLGSNNGSFYIDGEIFSFAIN